MYLNSMNDIVLIVSAQSYKIAIHTCIYAYMYSLDNAVVHFSNNAVEKHSSNVHLLFSVTHPFLFRYRIYLNIKTYLLMN